MFEGPSPVDPTLIALSQAMGSADADVAASSQFAAAEALLTDLGPEGGEAGSAAGAGAGAAAAPEEDDRI